MRKYCIALLGLAASLAIVGAAHGQQFPISGKPIRIVVPFAVGGGADTQARVVAQSISETLGVSVIVDNKPGASSVIGTREAASGARRAHSALHNRDYRAGATVDAQAALERFQ